TFRRRAARTDRAEIVEKPGPHVCARVGRPVEGAHQPTIAANAEPQLQRSHERRRAERSGRAEVLANAAPRRHRGGQFRPEGAGRSEIAANALPPSSLAGGRQAQTEGTGSAEVAQVAAPGLLAVDG